MTGACSTPCTRPCEQSVLIWLVAAPAISSSSAIHCTTQGAVAGRLSGLY